MRRQTKTLARGSTATTLVRASIATTLGWAAIAGLALAVVMLSHPARAQQGKGGSKPMSLDALLDQVEQDVEQGAEDQRERLAEFERKKQAQAELLEQARAEEASLVKKSEALEATFQENERRLKEQQDLLKERMGSLGELFGVVRQASGDTAALVRESIVSAQFRDRHQFLEKLGQSKELPSIKALEKLWLSLQREMTEQGRVVRFKSKVADAAGKERETQVVRVGTFNLVADGKYLLWLPEARSLVELPRQPEFRYTSLIGDLEQATAGPVAFAVDPSRGSLLALLVQVPDVQERLEAGGVIGQIIMYLGGITAFFALLRLISLVVVAARIRAQQQSPARPSKNNPLGRVLAVYQENRGSDVETLERKLDEVVLRESAALERFLWAVKVVAGVAPLLGLLGTVTGMITTFQSIMLFGAGNPKLMAGGISEALMTTMLGLIAAVPLVLIHSVLRNSARRMIDVLQEQAAGMIALQAEGGGAPPPSAAPPRGGQPATAELAPAGGE